MQQFNPSHIISASPNKEVARLLVLMIERIKDQERFLECWNKPLFRRQVMKRFEMLAVANREDAQSKKKNLQSLPSLGFLEEYMTGRDVHTVIQRSISTITSSYSSSPSLQDLKGLKPVKYSLRPFQSSDSEEVSRIEDDSFYNPWGDRKFANLQMSFRTISKVSVYNDQIIGFYFVRKRDGFYEIINLAVDKDWREYGVGTELVEDIKTLMLEDGQDFAVFSLRDDVIDEEDNIHPINFAEKRHFEFNVDTQRYEYHC